MIFGPLDQEIPEVDVSEQRISELLGDIKRNSRNRRIAMFAPVALAAAVLSALIAAPPRYGGLSLVSDADAEAASSELPRVFGSNGVWRLAEPIAEAPASDPGPASVIEAPTQPAGPSFTLSPPDQEEISSLPTSTSTPPMSTSGQSPEAPVAAAPVAAAEDVPTEDLDWSAFSAAIRIEETAPDTESAEVPVDDAEPFDADIVEAAVDADTVDADTVEADPVEVDPVEADPESSGESSSTPDPLASAEDTTTPDTSSTDESVDGDVSVAAAPLEGASQTEPTGDLAGNQTEANPSTPTDDSTDAESQAFSSEPAAIVQQSVLVYSAHVSVTVQVVDDDSSVIDWCNTRVDWGDGSVTGVADADGVATCTASCELEATPSAVGSSGEVGLNQIVEFTHEYTEIIDASPRVFVATGDGCSYTLAELQLNPFTVVPLP